MREFAQRQNRTRIRRLVSLARPDRAKFRHVRAWNPHILPQSAWGNQAMQRLLRTGTIQPKLKINERDDEFEQEADRVAETVIRMPETSVLQQAPLPRPLSPDRRVGSKDSNDFPVDLDEAISSSGRPLDKGTRDYFEPRFQRSFTDVRIYADRTADDLAGSIGARAFAAGNSLFFAAGKFNPKSQRGRHLLAHELAHVQQQDAAGISRIQCQTVAIQSPEVPEDPRFEGFSPAQALVVKYAESKALKLLDQMVVNLLPWIASVDTEVDFASEFHSLNPNRMIRVSLVMAHIREKLPGARYVFDANCKHLAHTLPLVGPIFICPAFFDQSIEGRYNTLIHEGAHRFACRLDLGYAFNKNYNTFSVVRQIWNAEPYGELAEKIGTRMGSTP